MLVCVCDFIRKALKDLDLIAERLASVKGYFRDLHLPVSHSQAIFSSRSLRTETLDGVFFNEFSLANLSATNPRARKTGHARPISILFSLIRAVNFKRIMNEIITDALE